MIRNLKTLGLATVAVLAMSAFVASAAQAQFTASSYPTTATATSALGNDVITTEGGTVECKGHYEGTASEASPTFTLGINWTECKAFGFASAEVNTNGCHFQLHFPKPIKWSIVCKIFGFVVLRAGNCEVQIGAQGPLSSFGSSNSGNHVNLQANVTGLAYTVTKDGFLCPFGGTGAKTGATYKQGAAVTLAPVSGGSSISID